MSKHADPAADVSPKVKSAAIWAAVVVVGGGALASAIASIPQSVWADLGPWGVPLGVFVGGLGTGLAAVVAAYQKGDWLRSLGAAAAVVGETPTGLPHPDSVPDATTAEADALALRAAELRRGGVS